jgi:putative oxidoreductase
MAASKSNGRAATNLGLLILRLGIGTIFVCLSYPLLVTDKETWRSLGQAAMEPIGVTFGFWMWGLVGVVIMLAGGAFVALGVLFRPSALCLLITTALITYIRYDGGQALAPGLPVPGGLLAPGYGSALGAAVACLALLVSGSGDYAVGKSLRSMRGKWHQ